MELMTMTTTRTAEKLAEMFTENTGINMLDSGGASGRNWQRNEGKTAADFLAEPEGENDDWLTLNAFHFCNKFLEFDHWTDVTTKAFRDWVDNSPKYPHDGAEYYNSPYSFGTWLEETLGITEQSRDNESGYLVFNTYNWENLLSQTLQGVEFELGDVKLVALSIHGGADVRGGYSDLVVFRRCECWLYQSGDAFTSCSNADCGITLDIRGCDHMFWDFEAQDEYPQPEGWELEHGCPKCKTGKFVNVSLGECWC